MVVCAVLLFGLCAGVVATPSPAVADPPDPPIVEEPVIERVSWAPGGEPNWESMTADISADGNWVVFVSRASNLVPGDTPGMDVFLTDRRTGLTERVSETPDGTGLSGASIMPSVSGDGSVVAFHTDGDPTPEDEWDDPGCYARMPNGEFRHVGVLQYQHPAGWPVGTPFNCAGLSLSDDGRYAVFYTQVSLVADDLNGSNDVYMQDLTSPTGATELVSRSWTGASVGNTMAIQVSADGRFVTFATAAPNVVPGDTNGQSDVFLRDRQAGTTERVSVRWDGAQVPYSSAGGSISADGRFVAFVSLSQITPALSNVPNVYLRDRQRGTVELVSYQRGSLSGARVATTGNGGGQVSADGRFVVWQSSSNFLVPQPAQDATEDAFVYDRVTGVIQRLSADAEGVRGDGHSYRPVISGKGEYAVFSSEATNLVADDTNGFEDVFARQVKPVGLASVRAAGRVATPFGEGRFAAVASRDGLGAQGLATFEVDTRTRKWRIVAREWTTTEFTAPPQGEVGGGAHLVGPCDVYSMPRNLPLPLRGATDRRRATCDWRLEERPHPGTVALAVTNGPYQTYLDVPVAPVSADGGRPGVVVHNVTPETWEDPAGHSWDRLRQPVLGLLRPFRDAVDAAGEDDLAAARARADADLAAAEPRIRDATSAAFGEGLRYIAFLVAGFLRSGCLTRGDVDFVGSLGPCVLSITDFVDLPPDHPALRYSSVAGLREWLETLRDDSALKLADVAREAATYVPGGSYTDLPAWALETVYYAVKNAFDSTVLSWVDDADFWLAQLQSRIRALPAGSLEESVGGLVNLVYGSTPTGEDDPLVFSVDDVSRALDSGRDTFRQAWASFWATFPADLVDPLYPVVSLLLSPALSPVLYLLFYVAGVWTPYENVTTFSQFGDVLAGQVAGYLQGFLRDTDVYAANIAADTARGYLPQRIGAVDALMWGLSFTSGVALPDSAEIMDGIGDMVAGDASDPGDPRRDETLREKLLRVSGPGIGALFGDFFDGVRATVGGHFDAAEEALAASKAPLLAGLDAAIGYLESPPPPDYEALVERVEEAMAASFASLPDPLGAAVSGAVNTESPPRFLARACEEGWVVLADVVCRVATFLPERFAMGLFAAWSQMPGDAEGVPYVDSGGAGTARGAAHLVGAGDVSASLSQAAGAAPVGGATYRFAVPEGDYAGGYVLSTSRADWGGFSPVSSADLATMDNGDGRAYVEGPCRLHKLVGPLKVRVPGELTCGWDLWVEAGDIWVALHMWGDVPPFWTDLDWALAVSGNLDVVPFPSFSAGSGLEAEIVEKAPIVVDDPGPTAVMGAWSPTAFPRAQADGRPGTAFTFAATARPGLVGWPVTGYEWDYDGDGVADESTTEGAVTHVYDAEANVVPRVRAVDERGRSSQWDAYDVLGVAPPLDVGYEAPEVTGGSWSPCSSEGSSSCGTPDGRPGTEFAFRVLFRDPDAPTGSEVVTAEWDLDGDGAVDLTTPVEGAAVQGEVTDVYVYPPDAPGPFFPRVRVTDNDGLSSAWTVLWPGPWSRSPLELGTIAPVATGLGWAPCGGLLDVLCAGRPDDRGHGTKFAFTAEFRDPDGAVGGLVTGVEWDWDGDGAGDLFQSTDELASGAVTAEHGYGEPGVYRPQVRFVDNDGLVGEWTTRTVIGVAVPLRVTEWPPVVTMRAWSPCARAWGVCGAGLPDGVEGETEFTFTADFRDLDSGAGGEVVTVEWDFGGDGVPDTLTGVPGGAGSGTSTVAHTFPAPGVYRPRVRVVDNDGVTSAWDSYDVLGSPQNLDVASR